MIQTEVQAEPVIEQRSSDPYADQSEVSLLDIVATILRHKRFLLRFVGGATVLALIVALVLPVQYEANVVLMPPAQNSSIASALMGEIGNALGSLASMAGGAALSLKNPADMYVALMKSRTVEDAVITRFGLMKEYHVKRMSDARKALERRTTILPGTKDGLIRLTLEDHKPERAAELANGYLDEYRKLSANLAISEAARRRLFFSQQLQQAKDALTAAEDAMTKTQQSTGVLQIDSQARSLIESAAILRAQVVAKEVQIEGMRAFATDDNPSLVLARQELAALQSQLDRLASSQKDTGSDINLSKGRVTQAGMEYIRSYRELKYQEAVFELLAKEFEIAKLDEAREGSIIQVVDSAVPPDRKSGPHRAFIVIGTAFLASVIALFWIYLRERSARAFELPENRERLREIKGLWKAKEDAV